MLKFFKDDRGRPLLVIASSNGIRVAFIDERGNATYLHEDHRPPTLSGIENCSGFEAMQFAKGPAT